MNNKLIIGLLVVSVALSAFLAVKVLTAPKSAPSILGTTKPGETSYWTGGGSFGADLSVGGDLSITGTSTFSGAVSGVPKVLSATMSSSATTTACSFSNSSGVDRVVTSLSVLDLGSATSLGATAWKAGTSTYTGVAPSINQLNTTLTRLSGVYVLSTTSTANATSTNAGNTVTPIMIQWRGNGEVFNFISGTTTNLGYCKLTYI